jgi:transporter family protein
MAWYIYALAGALIAALSALTEKHALKDEHAMQFSSVLAVINLLISVPLLLWVGVPVMSTGSWLLIYLGSICAAIAFLFVAKSTRHLEVSVVSPLLVAGPAVSALFAFFLLGETITPLGIGGIALVTLGAFLFMDMERRNSYRPILGKYLLFILGALLLYGGSTVIDRYILSRTNLSPLAYLAVIQIFIGFNFILLMSVFHGGVGEMKKTFQKFYAPLLLVAFLTVAYRAAQLEAVSLAKLGLVETIKRLSAVFTIILAGRLFHEGNIMKKVLTCALMILGVYLMIV